MNQHPEHTDDELNNAPLLRQLRQTAAFNAPEEYFQTLPSAIQDKISSRKSILSQFKVKPILAGLAIAGCLVLGFLYINRPVQERQFTETTTITTDDLIETGYYLEIEEQLIAESVYNDVTAQEESIDETEMENYLLESADETTLINEL
jgi:hypothetical protein